MENREKRVIPSSTLVAIWRAWVEQGQVLGATAPNAGGYALVDDEDCGAGGRTYRNHDLILRDDQGKFWAVGYQRAHAYPDVRHQLPWEHGSEVVAGQVWASNRVVSTWLDVEPTKPQRNSDAMLRTREVLREVGRERERQTAKHGDQSHLPLGFGPDKLMRMPGSSIEQVATSKQLELWARRRCKQASQNEGGDGSITFEEIVTEEWAELVASANTEETRKEAIQLAAVAVQIVEAIDRRWEAKQPVPGDTPEDALRIHLRDVHANEAALELADPEAVEQHWHEHFGPGGLRNHGEPPELHTWGPISAIAAHAHEAMVEQAKRQGDEELREQHPVEAEVVHELLAGMRSRVGQSIEGHPIVDIPPELIAGPAKGVQLRDLVERLTPEEIAANGMAKVRMENPEPGPARGVSHYRLAEQYLIDAKELWVQDKSPMVALRIAEVHATLAAVSVQGLMAAGVLNDGYPDADLAAKTEEELAELERVDREALRWRDLLT